MTPQQARGLWARFIYWVEIDAMSPPDAIEHVAGLAPDWQQPELLLASERDDLAEWIRERAATITDERAWAKGRRVEHVAKRIGLQLGAAAHGRHRAGLQACRLPEVDKFLADLKVTPDERKDVEAFARLLGVDLSDERSP